MLIHIIDIKLLTYTYHTYFLWILHTLTFKTHYSTSKSVKPFFFLNAFSNGTSDGTSTDTWIWVHSSYMDMTSNHMSETDGMEEFGYNKGRAVGNTCA